MRLVPAGAQALHIGMTNQHAALGRSLPERLAAALGASRGAQAAVAIASPDDTTGAAVGGTDEPVPIGCVVKLVTATLARHAVAAGQLGFATEIADVLGVQAQALRGITLRQLLEHTHGLDDSLFDSPPADREQLLVHAATLPRLAPPGAIYSYGNIGAWLTAALLERLGGRTYAELIRAELLAPLGLAECASSAVCPATGAGLELTATALAKLAVAASLGAERWPCAEVPGTHGRSTPLPGWNPLERGVYLGWKDAGEGWFGHQSTWPAASIFLRVHPATHTALVVAARSHAATVVAQRLFARVLPTLFRWPECVRDATKPLATQWLGRYERAALAVEVAQPPGGAALELSVRPTRGAPHSARLREATAGVAFIEPASEALPFLEFVSDSGGRRWLWNGRFMLRQTTCADTRSNPP